MAKVYNLDEERLPRPEPDFIIEGELEIKSFNGYPAFIIDDVHLSEFVAKHFQAYRNNGTRLIGRVRLQISRLRE